MEYIETIFDNAKDNNRYINDTEIDTIVSVLKNDGKTTTEIRKVVSKIEIYNQTLYKTIKEKNDEMKLILNTEHQTLPIPDWEKHLIQNAQVVSKENKKNKQINEDFRVYLNSLRECKNLEEAMNIIDEIESEKKKPYLYSILAELEKERIGAMSTLYNGIEEDMKELFIEEQENLSKTIEFIHECNNNTREDKTLDPSLEKTNIVLFSNGIDEPYLYRDIKCFTDEDKEEFNELIKRFERGSRNGYKKIVRGNIEFKQLGKKQVRILFDEEGEDYIVIGAFTKKSKDTRVKESTMMEMKFRRYIKHKYNFIERLKNSTFRREEEQTFEQFKDSVSTKSKKQVKIWNT